MKKFNSSTDNSKTTKKSSKTKPISISPEKANKRKEVVLYSGSQTVSSDEHKKLRVELNKMFQTARIQKPQYFNTLANDLKYVDSKERIFSYAKDFICGHISITELKNKVQNEKQVSKKHTRVTKKLKKPFGIIITCPNRS